MAIQAHALRAVDMKKWVRLARDPAQETDA